MIHSGMTEITNEELKRISLDILLDVKDYCERHCLQYYLVCGTALGAIRHNGFIPWDDDIDIGMPRPDYEKFLAGYRSETCYLLDPRSGRNYPYAFAKVCDKRTVLVEKIENPFPMGVYIDVFPIDGIPSDPKKQKQHLTKIDWDLRFISWKRISREKKLDRVHKLIQTVAKTVLAPVPFSVLIDRLDRDLKSVPYETSEFVGHLATKAYWGSDCKPKAIFEPPVKHAFEDREFCVPGDYDGYLTLEYGDYRKLPPVEKQVSHHDFVAYWAETQA